ncbi:unnamed protein product [Dracunculus medinensis]|uniref:Lysosomal acid phosphatase n=1 Tax=Dracunculus medinensis TaxID=318479 RepID=A0A0N4U8A4_DRAME|nr:unnamed protein product [Dracunculus medinensis]
MHRIELIVLIYYLINYATSNDELIYVQAVFRHGHRAPHQLPYPNDIYNETYWHYGWSQLTNLGIRQLYDLGKFFKWRYGEFIPEFDVKKVHVVSTDTDRTIASGEAMLFGFFPTTNESTWLEGETWRPIPIYTAPQGAPSSVKLMKAKFFQYFLIFFIFFMYFNIFFYIRKYTTVIFFRIIHAFYILIYFLLIFQIHNLMNKHFGFKSGKMMIFQILHNLTQPEWIYQKWASHDNLTTLQIIEEMLKTQLSTEFNSEIKIKLNGGLMLADWLQRALRVSNGTNYKPEKMMIYSAHHRTVLALQYAFGVNDSGMVTYGACFIMEVYRSIDGIRIKVIFFIL